MPPIDQNRIPDHEIDSLARCLFPAIIRFYESEEGQAEFNRWQQEQLERNNDVG